MRPVSERQMDVLNDVITEHQQVVGRYHIRLDRELELLRSAVLAESLGQSFNEEIDFYRTLVRQVRNRLYQVVCRLAGKGNGSVSDDLVALIEALDVIEKGDRDESTLPRVRGPREVASDHSERVVHRLDVRRV